MMYKGGLTMSEYKRWIAYIYSYDNGNKGNNIGYARVEMRDAKSKITIHINVLSVTEPMKVYLYVRENGVMKGIYIGDIYTRKGTGDASFTLKSQSVEDSGYKMQDVCGIIIYHNENKYFGSEWDDKPINLNESKNIIPEVLPEEPVKEPVAEVIYKDEAKPEAEISEVLEEASVEAESAVTVEAETEAEFAENDNSEGNEQNEGVIKKIEDAAEEMMEKYPRMYPFEDDEMLWCVRIEPQDIGHLPINTWVIANNSFLLHGYYSYRHLVLMKTADKYHPSYLIGVPGVYHNKDEFMAKMFGFELFKPMSNKKDIQGGEFGYWCISITDIV